MARPRVLCVDDDPLIRTVLDQLLEQHGCDVLWAGDVPGGERVVFSSFPDVVITDVMMPGESGYSLCRKIKADPSTRDIPVLFLTAVEDETEALKSGASAYLSKPIDGDELGRALGAILARCNGRAVLNRALAHVRAGRLDSALGGFDRLREEHPGTELALWAEYYAAQVHEMRGEEAEAVATLDSLLSRETGFWRAHNRLAMIHERRGDLEAATRHLQRSLHVNPAQPDLRRRLSLLRQDLSPALSYG